MSHTDGSLAFARRVVGSQASGTTTLAPVVGVSAVRGGNARGAPSSGEAALQMALQGSRSAWGLPPECPEIDEASSWL